MRTFVPLLSSMLFAVAAAAQTPTVLLAAPPAPTPSPSPAAAEARRLSLGLDTLLSPTGHGHAEFDTSLRRFWWDDPMTRLSFAVAREEAAAGHGGLVGLPVTFSTSAMLWPPPGADLRLVLAGPFASDWNQLTPQERFGRLAEGAVYYGLIIGLAHAIH